MPAVTVFWRWSGLPNATTHSPGLRSLLDPSFAVGNGLGEFTLITAMSDKESKLTTSPSKLRPSCNVTTNCRDIRTSWYSLLITTPSHCCFPLQLKKMEMLESLLYAHHAFVESPPFIGHYMSISQDCAIGLDNKSWPCCFSKKCMPPTCPQNSL